MLQCHVNGQNIHTIGGVVGDLRNGLANDGCKIRIIGVEAQLGTAPDVGHMMQAIFRCEK